MIAATPTACGEAIDVPWIHWYSAHTLLAQLRTSGGTRGTTVPGLLGSHTVVPFGTPLASTSSHATATLSGYGARIRVSGALYCGVPKNSRRSPPGAATVVCSTP